MMWVWTLLGVVALVILGTGLYGSWLITQVPYLAVPFTPKDFGWRWEDVAFRTEDGLALRGWFVPAEQPSAVTIIIQHGAGSNHGDMLLGTACLHRGGPWNLLYYNFRGHGDSDGRATSLGPLEVRDLTAALRFLREDKPASSQHIGIYGHSMGAAVALVGAARHPEIEAVAAESSYATLTDTITRFSRIYHGIPNFPFVPLARLFASWRLGVRINTFAPVREVGRIAPRPIFFIQGEQDLRVPMKEFQALWNAAKEPKEQWVVPRADHGEPWVISKDEYERRLVSFFRKALI